MYGDLIIVERKINKSSGPVRLFSAAGNLVSSGVKELKAMLDYLMVMPSNPIVVMT